MHPHNWTKLSLTIGSQWDITEMLTQNVWNKTSSSSTHDYYTRKLFINFFFFRKNIVCLSSGIWQRCIIIIWCPVIISLIVKSHLEHLERMLRVVCAVAQSEAPWRSAAQGYAHIMSSAHPPDWERWTFSCSISEANFSGWKTTIAGVQPSFDVSFQRPSRCVLTGFNAFLLDILRVFRIKTTTRRGGFSVGTLTS